MKSRGVPQFTSKLSEQLSKFKDSSTINIAHEQIRKLFGQYGFAEIANQFASKMDSCDRLSDREKKQYAKLYISLIDAYGAEVLYQQYYERIMESLSKKTIGVGEVIGHLCKNLLSRIHPPQNTLDYISYILNLFRNHSDVCKIIRNIMQSIEPAICVHFQQEMVSIINEKINNKSKIQAVEALLAVILTLQENFQYEQIAHSLVSKNCKNQDYNVRKTCVDICYALLVVREETNPLMHRIVKELKYDKIKHVRDAVANYFALYKQIFGQQQETKKMPVTNNLTNDFDTTKRGNNKQKVQKNIQFSPMNTTQRKATNQRNQTFFKNAKNSHVIKIADENNKSAILLGQQKQNIEQEQDQYQQQQYDRNQNYLYGQRQDNSNNVAQPDCQNGINKDLREYQGIKSKFPRDFEQYLKNRQYKATDQRNVEAKKNQKSKLSQVQIVQNKNSKKAYFKTKSKEDSDQIFKRQQVASIDQSQEHLRHLKNIKKENLNNKNGQKQIIKLPNRGSSIKQDQSQKQAVYYQKKCTQQQIKQMNIAQLILSLKNSMFQKLDKIQYKVNSIDTRVSRIQKEIFLKSNRQSHQAQENSLKQFDAKAFQQKQKATQNLISFNQSQIKQDFQSDRLVEDTSPFQGSYEIDNNQESHEGTIVQQLNGLKSSQR